jgi:hypothetical protein
MRANRVFCADIKRIRAENTVPEKTQTRAFSMIGNGARMCFSSMHHCRSARTGRRPRKFIE